jgi:hypothetical protein
MRSAAGTARPAIRCLDRVNNPHGEENGFHVVENPPVFLPVAGRRFARSGSRLTVDVSGV